MWDWDEAKRQRTLQDRGIDFADVTRFDLGTADIRPDLRRDYGELRFRAIGMLDGRLHVLIFTPRAEGVRVISLRRANARECREMADRPEQQPNPQPGLAEDAAPFRRLRPDEPDEENPEWTAEDFARAKTIWDFPDLVEVFQKSGQLGRRPLPEDQRKKRVTLYLDPDVLARLRADGKGWQTRANAALRKALGL
jgi:uncharacterized DUF497 family protein/uncharacterized protein (DUF4415 family)